MKNIKNRIIVVIVLSLLSSLIVFHFKNTKPLTNDTLFNFPLTFGKWVGSDVPMEERIFESLETSYAILHDYISPDGERINLAVVWYDDKEIAFHSASACLGGVGDRVIVDQPYDIVTEKNTYHISKIITEKYTERRMVLYYYVSDGYITGSQLEIRKHIFLKRLQLKRASAAFVRIMMPIDVDQEKTRNTMEEFFLDTLSLISKYTDTYR